MMINNNFNDITVGFIGLGLIGGSLAKALRDKYPNITIMAYEHAHSLTGKIVLRKLNEVQSKNQSLSEDNELGLRDHVLDLITDSLNDFSSCHIIFLCAPISQNIEYLKTLKDIINPDCIITDVGSVKSNIHKYVIEYGLESNFIGGHPMTGSEKSGYENSNPKLFENAYYILTRTRKTNQEQLELMSKLVKDIAAIPIELDYAVHDKAVAAISHLPHVVAASLVNLVKNQGEDSKLMKKLAAGGFRDITRIASSSPEIWENISISNRDFIINFLNEYIDLLEGTVRALDREDTRYIYNTFASAKDFRNEIPDKGKGILGKVFEIYLDIDDEAGAIAMVATLLAYKNISIKNIGIIHNREFHDGVLRVAFYDEYAMENAINLLKKRNYTVYERK